MALDYFAMQHAIAVATNTRYRCLYCAAVSIFQRVLTFGRLRNDFWIVNNIVNHIAYDRSWE